MNFFSTIKATFWNPSFYRQAAEQHTGAFGYYFKLALLLSFVATVAFALFIGPGIHAAMRALPDAIVSYYPDDLEVTLTDGAITVNQPQPYALPLPPQLQGEGADAGPTHLVVFDTEATFSTERFKAYDTFMLVTRDALVMQGDNDIRIVPTSDLACESDTPDECNFTLTNDKLASFMEQLKPLSAYLLPILAVGMLLVLMVVYTFGLLSLLLTSLLALFVVRVWAKTPTRLSYKQVYRLCLYAITPALIITTIAGIARVGFGIPTPFIDGYLFELLLTLAVLVFNLRAAYPTTIPHAESTPSSQQ